MKLYLYILVITLLTSCSEDKSIKITNSKRQNLATSIIQHKHVLNNSYEVGFYSKSYSYYRVFDKDTLDFVLCAMEHENDNTLHLDVQHKKAMLFATMLENLTECVPLIKEDFEFSKLNSINLKSPIHYLDLTKELSNEYELRFGKTSINHQKLNHFLLHSTLNKRLDSFLIPFKKQVKGYAIEKFHLLDKKYFGTYLPETDLKDYPEFALEGMGVYIYLESR